MHHHMGPFAFYGYITTSCIPVFCQDNEIRQHCHRSPTCSITVSDKSLVEDFAYYIFTMMFVICALQVEITRRIVLENLPPVLVLHLKCFVYDKSGGSQKVLKHIEYSVDLEINKGQYHYRFMIIQDCYTGFPCLPELEKYHGI